ncbi:hypothetical protein Hdeb2414_s0025g00667001 [Helianthus debilis subsp. tardiflorus]
MRGAPCGVRPLGSLPCGVRPLGSLPCGVRRLGSLPCGVRRLGSLPCGMSRVTMRRAATWLKPVHARCGVLAHVRPCGGAACATSLQDPCTVRPLDSLPCGVLAHCRAACAASPCGVRPLGSSPSMRGAASWLTSVHAAVRRAPRHCRTHAPCTQPRASYTRARMRMSATSCAASPTTWSLQPLCFTPRARSKIQRRLSSGSRRCERAKCAIKAPHCASSPTPRARARARSRVRVRVLRTLREDTSVCFHETIRMESSTLNTHLSSISPPMWDKVLLSL